MDDTLRIFSCYESPSRILHFAIRGGVGGFLFMAFVPSGLFLGVWTVGQNAAQLRNETEIRIAI